MEGNRKSKLHIQHARLFFLDDGNLLCENNQGMNHETSLKTDISHTLMRKAPKKPFKFLKTLIS